MTIKSKEFFIDVVKGGVNKLESNIIRKIWVIG